MAIGLARRGHDVAVHYDRSAAEAEETVAAIRSLGVRGVALQADLLDEDATQRLVPAAVAALGPLTVLINNASIFEHDRLDTATREGWDRHFGSNLRAPFVLTQHFAAQVPEAARDGAGEPVAGGVIINMVDQRVLKPTPEFITYALAKSALWSLTRMSAQALAPRVRVNAIGPGPTMRGERQSVDHFARQRAATILERGADEDDIVGAMDYLVGAKSVTGQLICPDGGQHLQWRSVDIVGLE